MLDDWFMAGLEDEVRPRMLAAAAAGRAFSLVTITQATGGGPRGRGAQMFVGEDAAAGFLSGGCIEADVVLHARSVLADGRPRRLVYGQGSPFADIRLPCGGRLELLVERIAPGDGALAELAALNAARRPAAYWSDGTARRCAAAELGARAEAEAEGEAEAPLRIYRPDQRLIVVGSEPFALAIAALGARMGWPTVVVRPKGPEQQPPLEVGYDRRPAGEALAALAPDRWTAVAVAGHEVELDHEALLAALNSDAGYVGLLGSRRRLPEHRAALARAGVTAANLERLKAPIGLDIGARAPLEIAVSVVAEIIASRGDGG